MSDIHTYAADLIQEAIDGQDTHLDLSGLELEHVPDLIGQAISLTHLSLRDNQLKTLPVQIGQLQNLLQLSLVNNQLTALPDELAQCANLTNLNLKSNRLVHLPEGVLNLSRLENLQLAGNPLPLPPEVIARWNRPQEIISFYREKFPPVVPPPPPPDFIKLVAHYLEIEDLRAWADLLTVPPEELTAETHHDLADQFIGYHIRHGLDEELRELLEVFFPLSDWSAAVYGPDPPEEGEDGHNSAI